MNNTARELCLNDIGQDVRQLQTLINQKYGLTLIEDGIYGKKTLEVIEQIQTNSNLSVTGICDRHTLKVIEQEKDWDYRGQMRKHKNKYLNKNLLRFVILIMPLLIMAIFLLRPDLIAFIFHKDRLKIFFFVSCVAWISLIVNHVFGLEVNQLLTELLRYFRDFIKLYNQ
ncbi:peptidoglycan-binding protein [Xenococcus sp. PCC 7305]|uniref:peptidoglycan-binding domain-containing protein n=1 Tax=Xenococcus sp. PCC 7305 TaxID=102125 RepID=UPI00130D6D18|nr:peptidoglycan-binding domain-containing protein [Xenococcus sp. PCC 7305]